MVSYAEDQELGAFWSYLKRDSPSFGERREAFFCILRRLLVEKKIKLVHMYTKIPMSGSYEEQVELFSELFPKNEEEMDNGVWFLMRECPGGAVWLHD
ncbi:DUF596 domain-containing protein [Variovorax sp. J22P240]|uniref:DUF596 domain-containing protein n=1 Tax=Variovorax sp. J22P240 TaxID=3053514 RepID=UPI002574A82A|nr:DUF596 domain-containing protein [Variovorax sp. J22P240]MDL9998622.1 DUF596 domain-containing protein [Variovorax sp. J22P240]